MRPQDDVGRQTVSTYLLLLVCALLFFSGCDSNEPDDPRAGEEEVITLVRLTLTPVDTGPARDFVATFDEAGVLQSAATMVVAAGVTYSAEIGLQNTLVSPPENITVEIRDEEPHAHRFFYSAEGDVSDNITVSDLDLDPNGDPLGLEFLVVVLGGAGESGQFRVKLRHYEQDANLPDDKRNDTATAAEVPGVVENDVDFTFPVQIQ